MSEGFGRRVRRFAFLTAAIVMVGCTGSEPASVTRYAADGIAFDHPRDWTAIRTTTDPLLEGSTWELEVRPPDQEVGSLFLAAYAIPDSLTDHQLMTLAENYFRFEENEALGFRIDEPIGSTSVGGVDAIEAHMSQELGNLEPRERRAFVFAVPDAAFVMSCYYERGDTAACDQLIDTFEFEDVEP